MRSTTDDRDMYPARLLYLPRGTKRLEELGERKSYEKGRVLIRPNETPDCCYVVKSGRVVGYEITINGDERIYNLNEPGSVLLEANVLMRWPSQVYFKTTAPTVLIAISYDKLMRAVSEDNELSFDILQSVCTKFFSAMDQVRQSSAHNVAWKVCDLLLIFARRYGVEYDGKVLIKERLSQQMISNLLGINRITAVRAIGDLKNLNLIEQINGFYCIRDMDALKRHQDFQDAQMAKR